LNASAQPEREQREREQPGPTDQREPTTDRWHIRLEVDEPESRVAAAVDDDGVVIGLATAGVTRDQDGGPAWELYSIQVTAEQQGSGMADDLIRLTAADPGAQLDTTVWVRGENARAQSFYRRHGFTVEGATREDETVGASEVRMVRRCDKR